MGNIGKKPLSGRFGTDAFGPKVLKQSGEPVHVRRNISTGSGTSGSKPSRKISAGDVVYAGTHVTHKGRQRQLSGKRKSLEYRIKRSQYKADDACSPERSRRKRNKNQHCQNRRHEQRNRGTKRKSLSGTVSFRQSSTLSRARFLSVGAKTDRPRSGCEASGCAPSPYFRPPPQNRPRLQKICGSW